MPVSQDNDAVFAIVPKEVKAQVRQLRAIDKVLYSESRVVAECVKAYLPTILARAGLSFPAPTKQTSGRKTKRAA